MTTREIKALKREIEKARRESAMREATIEELKRSEREKVKELREILGCEKGREKKTLAKLKDGVETDREKLAELIEDIEGLMTSEDYE